MRHHLQPASKWLQKFIKRPSIQQTIQNSYIIIIVLMLIAPIVIIASSWVQTIQYDQLITNVSRTNRLNQIVKTDISNELWDIVAGNKAFKEGIQYRIIDDINNQLNEISRNTKVKENRQLLEVAGRAMNTLTIYVDRMGYQMRNQYPVTENEMVLDEIRAVADLVSDILQDFIVLEIEAAADTNEMIKKNSVLLSLLSIATVLFVTIFAAFAQHTVALSINKPIEELEKLSSQIASGNLAARAQLPQVYELNKLTDNLNTMAVKIQELIAANIQEQKNLQKSEMKALQAQISPHFLYNTLDTIIWLAEVREYDQVINVTRNFSAFFRSSLNRGKDWTTVSNEFDHVRNYLMIQKVRYRDILDYTIECDQSLAEKPMLKLLLQPLVENALYHGIKNKRGKGCVCIKAWPENGLMCFEVTDNGIGMSTERLDDIRKQIDASTDSSSINDVYGLYNVNKRLSLYYNADTRLYIRSTYREGTTVTFSLPESIAHV